MASDERMQALLDGAGFTIERVEDVAVRFRYGDVDEYVLHARDTGGMFAKVWQGASDEERRAITAQLADAFVPFAVGGGGYELPGMAACVVAS
jgi:alkanesulfonate monooxygenase SsuD/methylene tetrahydromethanopterin reductase-like flavin-dependent oxidoreductase (luciferase family)